MRFSALAFTSLVALSAGLSHAQSVGSINGTLTDDKSKPVSGSHVVATPLGTGGGITLTAVSDAAGKFTFANVKPATYQFCVQAPGTAWLDPCRWGQPVKADVASGKAATVSLRVISGSILRIRVQDPARKYLNAVSANAPDLMVGVMNSSSVFFPVAPAAKNDVERTFEAAIPLDTPLRVGVYGGQLQLADEKGSAIVAGSNLIAVQHSSGRANPDIKLTVTGKK